MVLEPLVWNTRPGACEVEPPGGGQRALVDDGDVGPASGGELVRERGADDAGADDDHAGSCHAAPPSLSHRDSQRNAFIRNNRVRPRRWVSRGPGRFAAPAGTRRWPAARRGSRAAARGGHERVGSAGQRHSQALTLSGLASTHFLAAASAVILSSAMYLATWFWSSLVQCEVLHQVVRPGCRSRRTSSLTTLFRSYGG